MSQEQPPKLDADRRITIQRVQTVKGSSTEELDDLPFGVIQVDRDGVVLAYNATEAELASKDAQAVIGQNFFTEVAPCTNVQEFAGVFRNGVARGRVQVTFPYRFTFEKGPVHVMISIHYEEPDDSGWIFVDGAKAH